MAQVASEALYFGIKQIAETIMWMVFSAFFFFFTGKPKLTVVKFAKLTGCRREKKLFVEMELWLDIYPWAYADGLFPS